MFNKKLFLIIGLFLLVSVSAGQFGFENEENNFGFDFFDLLENLNNVIINSPLENQTLIYNSTSGIWYNGFSSSNLSASSSYWNKTGSNIWTTDNVGIGLNNPTKNLEVEGTTKLTATESYQYFEITPTLLDLVSINKIGLGDVYEENTGTKFIAHIDEEKFTFDYGNVGIYNLNPTHALDVIGSGHFTGNTSSNTDFCITDGTCLSATNTNNSLWSYVNGTIQTLPPVLIGEYITPILIETFTYNYGDDDGYILHRNSGPHEFVQTWYNEETGVVGEFNIDTTPGVYQFEIKTTDENYNMVLGAGGTTNIFEINGSTKNVGINTGNPSTELEVIGDTSISETLYLPGILSGTDNSVLIKDSDNSIRTDEIDSRVWGPSLTDGLGSNNHIPYWTDSNTLSYSNKKLTWDPEHNYLGIGTTPEANLHIKDTDPIIIIQNQEKVEPISSEIFFTDFSNNRLGKISFDLINDLFSFVIGSGEYPTLEISSFYTKIYGILEVTEDTNIFGNLYTNGNTNTTGIVYQSNISKAYAQTDYHNETNPLEINLITEDVYENITGLHFAYNNSIHLNGQATIDKDGMYQLTGSVSFSGGNSGLYRYNLFVNNEEIHACGSMRSTSSTAIGSISINCIVELFVNDKVNMRIKDTTSPVQDVEIYTLTFNMVEL